MVFYLVWSFLPTAEIRFSLFCLRWKIGLVFLLTVPPPSGFWIWSFLLAVPPPSKKTNRKRKDLNKVNRGFAKGVAGSVSLPISSVFFRFLPFSSVFLRFFFPFSSVFFRFLPFFLFSSVFCFRFIFRKKRGDTVRETPFAKPRAKKTHPRKIQQRASQGWAWKRIVSMISRIAYAFRTSHRSIDGAIVVAVSLARVIVAIRITCIRRRPYLPPRERK